MISKMNRIKAAKQISALKNDIKIWNTWLESSLKCNAPNTFKEACTRMRDRKVYEIQKQIDELQK